MRPREVWRIGDWGGASGHIGRRWEEVGAPRLRALVGEARLGEAGFVPRAAVLLVADRELERAVHAGGLTNPDAVLLGPLGGHLALQAVDFKWSLEVARIEQIAGDSLRALLEADAPGLHRALEVPVGVVAGEERPTDGRLPPLDDLTLLDGLFLAPDHGANRAFLDSQANLRRAVPLSRGQVVFEPVDGSTFFSPLPGWEVGVALAAQEGARRALETLEGAEHYYRLGAGVLGALIARRRSIFDPEVPRIDALAELAGLRRDQRLMTTERVIRYLERIMSARSELVKTLNQLGRTIYPFGAFRQALTTVGISLPERTEATPESRRWSRLYGQAQRELAARLAAEGRALVAGGQTDAQAVAGLTARGPDLGRQAAAIAARLIAAEAAVG